MTEKCRRLLNRIFLMSIDSNFIIETRMNMHFDAFVNVLVDSQIILFFDDV